MKKILSVFILIVMLYYNGFSQYCGGGEAELYSGTYCETESEGSVSGSGSNDRNSWFDGAGNTNNQDRSQVYNHNFPTYNSWNDGCEGGDAPAPRGWNYEVELLSETYDWSQVDACCESAFEGLFFNFYDVSTSMSGPFDVIADGANGSCNASGSKFGYMGGSVGAPQTKDAECMADGAPDQIGFDVVPSFVINDGNRASCPNCSQAISDGAVSFTYIVTLKYVYCESDYTTPCTPTNDASCVVVSVDNISVKSEYLPEEDRVMVKWWVVNAVNVNRYEVFRSENGLDFEKMISVKATDAKAINDLYWTPDKNISQGQNYTYKILIVDNDGTEEWSNITQVKTPSLMPQVQFYPIPTSGVLNIVLGISENKFAPFNIKFTDVSGKEVYQLNIKKHTSNVKIDLSTLGKGVYYAIINNDETQKIRKVIII